MEKTLKEVIEFVSPYFKMDCLAVLGRYSNKRLEIQLVSAKDSEPIATATVNLPDEQLEEDEVCIKDYSENEGVLASLIKAGVISEPVRFTGSGFVSIPICKFLKGKEVKI